MKQDASKKKSKLGAMKMPSADADMHMYGESDEMPADDPELAAKEEEYGMDLDMDKEEGEDPEHVEKVLGGKGGDGMAAKMERITDEELLAELKRRGLDGKAEPDEDDMAADYSK